MEKLLIADPSPEFCAELLRAAGGLYDVRCCGDGATALELEASFQPKVLILSLTLPVLDGFGVIQALEQRPGRPKIIVLSAFINEYIQTFLTRPSVDYAMLKPCDTQAILCHVEQLCRVSTPQIMLPSVHSSAEAALFHLGIPLRLGCGQCVLAALTRYLEDPTQAVTKELYPYLARRQGKTAMSVEKAIRQAITVAWTHRDDRVWRQYFRPLPDGSIPRPTNQQFLQVMAERLLPAAHQKAN